MGKQRGPQQSMDVFCVIDARLVPPERVRRGCITCCEGCAKRRRKQQMQAIEQAGCKYCRRPATPEERLRYKRWRAAEAAAAKTSIDNLTKTPMQSALDVLKEFDVRGANE